MKRILILYHRCCRLFISLRRGKPHFDTMLFIMFLPESGVSEPYGCCILCTLRALCILCAPCILYALCTLRTLQLLHVLIVGFHQIRRIILLRFFLFSAFFIWLSVRFTRWFFGGFFRRFF